MILLGLTLILVIILLAPFSYKKAEEELELFLLLMGIAAVSLSAQWSVLLLREALTEPIKISCAVFFAGLLFKFFQKPIADNVNKIACRLGIKLFVFMVIVVLGFLSSIITAIVAALILVEIVTHLKLAKTHEIFLVVMACFAVGFGAALTPLGEPLSVITIAKLKGFPYQAGFFFLLSHLGIFIVLGIVLFAFFAAAAIPDMRGNVYGFTARKAEGRAAIALRSVKIYFFIAALVLLGKGLKPLVDAYVIKIPAYGLYWANMLSAVVDNATLAAAEITPGMNLLQIKSALLGMIVAGGMLIPGNIPNIICAGKLDIKSSQWARYGLPLGLIAMTLFFFLLTAIH